jgi:hypothetical protein
MKFTMMIAGLIVLLLAGTVPTAQAVQCARGVVRAGCVGPNGAVAVGPYGRASTIRPGASATGVRGNTATKGIAPGCAFVNGQRVCR